VIAPQAQKRNFLAAAAEGAIRHFTRAGSRGGSGEGDPRKGRARTRHTQSHILEELAAILFRLHRIDSFQLGVLCPATQTVAILSERRMTAVSRHYIPIRVYGPLTLQRRTCESVS